MKQSTRQKSWALRRVAPKSWAAYMIALGLLLVSMNFSVGDDVPADSQPAGKTSEKTIIGKKEAPSSIKIIAAEEPAPKITTSGEGDEQTVQKVAPNAKVTLNGKRVKFSDLKKGDVVKVTSSKDDKTVAMTIEATRPDSGKLVDVTGDSVRLSPDGKTELTHIVDANPIVTLNGSPASMSDLLPGDNVKITPSTDAESAMVEATRPNLLHEFWENFRHNLFKPLLLFFYMGFSVPILKIAFEFPHVIYQGLTIYLLLAIGWHGGEELAHLKATELNQALGFMGVGFFSNFVIGILSFVALRVFIPKLRRVDAATVSAYYGSDSAGTFVTCTGVLIGAGIQFAPYMPVMLAVMEIPGCLVGLFLVARLRHSGMDPLGNMPDEPGYDLTARGPASVGHGHGGGHGGEDEHVHAAPSGSVFNADLLREVFLNPGIFLLFGGIAIGWISGMQGHKVTDPDDKLFLDLFQGLLCLFLLEMGMTASKRLKDLRTAGWKFILFGILAPNIFATIGILMAHFYGMAIHEPFQLGTYVLFSVLCGAASYIAVPAIQRLAIPEASPTLPLAASLGLTFSYNVTVGIPVYILIASYVMQTFPIT